MRVQVLMSARIESLLAAVEKETKSAFRETTFPA